MSESNFSRYEPLTGTTASQYILNTFEACVKLGCDEATLLETIPGGQKALHNPSHRFDANVMIDMIHAAENLTGLHGFGVLAGNYPRMSALAELGHAMVAADTLEKMINMYRKYQALLQGFAVTDLFKHGDMATLTLETQAGTDPNYLRPYVERFFGAIATFGRWVTWDQTLSFESLTLMHDAPPDISAYESIFKCDLIFNADRNAISFERSLIEHPLPQPNPGLVDSICHRLDQALLALGSPVTTTRETLSLVKAMLPDGAPSILKVADAMGRTERTLRRRLKEENTTYSQVLEDARRDACDLMISRGIRSPSALSEALGYSETSAFTRAFKKWHGVPPSQYIADQSEKSGAID